MLSEGGEHLLGASWRQSATVVSDLDEHSPAQRIGSQLDLSVGVRELEGVLEKVGQGGQKEISVHVDTQAGVYVLYLENATLRVRLQLAGILGICNERGYRQGFATFGGADSYIVDRQRSDFPSQPGCASRVLRSLR